MTPPRYFFLMKERRLLLLVLSTIAELFLFFSLLFISSVSASTNKHNDDTIFAFVIFALAVYNLKPLSYSSFTTKIGIPKSTTTTANTMSDHRRAN
jgi:hypothetical protein